MSLSEDLRSKVWAIFEEMAPGRAGSLCEGLCDDRVASVIKAALMEDQELRAAAAEDIGFHLSDWHVEAAFLVAVHLFPERFTPEEVSQGVSDFLIHAPGHVAAAAAIYGTPASEDYVDEMLKESRRNN